MVIGVSSFHPIIFGKKNALAVEPVKSNFDCLSENNRLNGHRFTAVRGAVSETGGQLVQINFDPDSIANVAASLIAKPEYALSETDTVESVTIDQLVDQFSEKLQPVVIKLDVEGWELAAIKGAEKTLDKDFLLIYEEHGSDTHHAASRYVLEKGFFVFHMEKGRYTSVSSITDVESMKISSSKGYNLFAYKKSSSFSDLINRTYQKQHLA